MPNWRRLTPVGSTTGVFISVTTNEEAPRSRALDAWDYRVPFARFHIRWGEGDISPAFEQAQAYAIALQDLKLNAALEVWGHREVLVTFTSEHIQVGHGLAEGEPAWVVMVAGLKRERQGAGQDPLGNVPAGGGCVVQVLIHARTGELLLGTAMPVALQRR